MCAHASDWDAGILHGRLYRALTAAPYGVRGGRPEGTDSAPDVFGAWSIVRRTEGGTSTGSRFDARVRFGGREGGLQVMVTAAPPAATARHARRASVTGRSTPGTLRLAGGSLILLALVVIV